MPAFLDLSARRIARVLRSVFPIVYVEDVERSRRFYADLLGFEPGYRWPEEGELRFLVLRLEDSALAVAKRSTPAAEPRFELCAYTDDVDATVETLRAAGVPVLSEPEDMPWGERMAYVADPDGHRLQLTAR